MKRQGLGSFIHIYIKVVQQKTTWFSMNYVEESIDINAPGQIIVSIASFAIIAINSPTAPGTSSAYNEAKCHS